MKEEVRLIISTYDGWQDDTIERNSKKLVSNGHHKKRCGTGTVKRSERRAVKSLSMDDIRSYYGSTEVRTGQRALLQA